MNPIEGQIHFPLEAWVLNKHLIVSTLLIEIE